MSIIKLSLSFGMTQDKKRVIKIASSKSDSATGTNATSSSSTSSTATKKLSHSPSTSSNSPNRKVSVVPVHLKIEGITGILYTKIFRHPTEGIIMEFIW